MSIGSDYGETKGLFAQGQACGQRQWIGGGYVKDGAEENVKIAQVDFWCLPWARGGSDAHNDRTFANLVWAHSLFWQLSDKMISE